MLICVFIYHIKSIDYIMFLNQNKCHVTSQFIIMQKLILVNLHCRSCNVNMSINNVLFIIIISLLYYSVYYIVYCTLFILQRILYTVDYTLIIHSTILITITIKGITDSRSRDTYCIIRYNHRFVVYHNTINILIHLNNRTLCDAYTRYKESFLYIDDTPSVLHIVC